MATISHTVDAVLYQLTNPQATDQYDSTVRTKANRTNVTAKQYDSSQTTKKPSMKVTSTVEGSR